ncbi:MAG: hypothetical protein ACJ72W_27660 [Actinoallomurus sp.]
MASWRTCRGDNGALNTRTSSMAPCQPSIAAPKMGDYWYRYKKIY